MKFNEKDILTLTYADHEDASDREKQFYMQGYITAWCEFKGLLNEYVSFFNTKVFKSCASDINFNNLEKKNV